MAFEISGEFRLIVPKIAGGLSQETIAISASVKAQLRIKKVLDLLLQRIQHLRVVQNATLPEFHSLRQHRSKY